jgi:hypothetical protein
MRNHKLLTIIALFTMSLSLYAVEGLAGDASCRADEYKIMSLLVREQYGSEFSMILIGRDTEPWCLREQLTPLQRQWPELKGETIDALIVNNSGETRQLEEKFRLPVEYRLISEEEYHSALRGGRDSDDETLTASTDMSSAGAQAYDSITDAMEPNWDNFDSVYPDAQGYLVFSRVAFDSECSQALVIYSNAYRCSGDRARPGTRKIAYFARKDGAWELVGISKAIKATD